MQVIEGTWAVWMVWGMLLAGAGLVLASLGQASERFWYWKQARQMAAGEVAPAAEALRVGQHFCIVPCEENNRQRLVLPLKQSDRTADTIFTPELVGALSGRIIGISKNQLRLLLEPEAVTREEEKAQGRNQPVQAGEMLTVQITGSSELFRFTAAVHSVSSDPEQPLKRQVTVNLPFWLARIQRRQHVRASIDSGVTVQVPGENNGVHNSAEIRRGTLRDVSGGGLCLEIDIPQRPDTLARLCEHWGGGALLKCRLNMPLMRETPLNLRVHSCERIVVRGGLGLRIRGEFTDLPAWQQETLINVVFEAQRQHLRRHVPRFQTAM